MAKSVVRSKAMKLLFLVALIVCGGGGGSVVDACFGI